MFEFKWSRLLAVAERDLRRFRRNTTLMIPMALMPIIYLVILGKAMGRSLEFVQVPIEDVRKSGGDYATMLEWFDRVGYDVHIRSRSREFGIRPTSLADWAVKVSWR